jgi:hypothetical protein
MQLAKSVEESNLEVECLKLLSADQRCGFVLCAKVLQHFSAQNVFNYLNLLKEVLSDSVKLLISVPIEIGLAGLAKNLVRILVGQTHDETSSRNLCDAFFDKPIYRGNNHYIHSHLGFSYKKFEYLIMHSGFSIDENAFRLSLFLDPLRTLRYFSNVQ